MAGGMGQLLIVCLALAEEPNLVHSIHTGISQRPLNPAPGNVLPS